MLVAFTFTVDAQKQLKSFANDTVQAETLTYVSNKKVEQYANQVVIFAFTHTDIQDSLSVAKMQGSVDNTNFFDLTDATASLTETTTDGTTALYVTNPKFLYYRALLTAATGDTVKITNAYFIVKEDK